MILDMDPRIRIGFYFKLARSEKKFRAKNNHLCIVGLHFKSHSLIFVVKATPAFFLFVPSCSSTRSLEEFITSLSILVLDF
jgi:hypothetical protein